MTTTANAVANEFIKLAREPLTCWKLNDLVYIAQGYSLAINDCQLYRGNIRAYHWGPVIQKLYKSLRERDIWFVTDYLDGSFVQAGAKEIVKTVYDSYSYYTGGQLAALTRKPGTPWHDTWNVDQFGVIDSGLIGAYYRRLVEKHGQA